MTLWRDRLKLNKKRAHWLAIAQHDLWQPLQSIQLYVNALLIATPANLPRLLMGLQLASVNAVNCMRHLQDWYEVNSSDKALTPSATTIKANDLLQPLITECKLMAHSQCISLRYCSNQFLLNVDAVALQRMVRNLIHNALAYTPAGGKVLVGCRRKREILWIYCFDNGVGMTEAQLKLCTQACLIRWGNLDISFNRWNPFEIVQPLFNVFEIEHIAFIQRQGVETGGSPGLSVCLGRPLYLVNSSQKHLEFEFACQQVLRLSQNPTGDITLCNQRVLYTVDQYLYAISANAAKLGGIGLSTGGVLK